MAEARQTRRQTRRPVNLDAQIALGGDLIIGTLLDLSSDGTFFRPEAAFMNRWFMQLTQPAEQPRVEDAIRLEIIATADAIGVDGTVRWIGHHGGHGCEGMGIQFAQPTLLAVR